MAKEIERKFLLADDSYRTMATKSHHIVQGYLVRGPLVVLRVRIKDEHAFITIKTRNEGCVRNEWEYEIPMADAQEMLQLCTASLEKVRYIVPYAGYVWEIDEFSPDLNGLKVAEIELESPDAQFELPTFIGVEVTGNPMYFNSNLAMLKGKLGGA